ncbi:hypothetical protein K438DRAFT_1755523 [Mycena galopus ATCC 62051]|nr:hypothetical protein K438DRAFT_1755523 [Mycena galopus ATCC 62051]
MDTTWYFTGTAQDRIGRRCRNTEAPKNFPGGRTSSGVPSRLGLNPMLRRSFPVTVNQRRPSRAFPVNHFLIHLEGGQFLEWGDLERMVASEYLGRVETRVQPKAYISGSGTGTSIPTSLNTSGAVHAAAPGFRTEVMVIWITADRPKSIKQKRRHMPRESPSGYRWLTASLPPATLRGLNTRLFTDRMFYALVGGWGLQDLQAMSHGFSCELDDRTIASDFEPVETIIAAGCDVKSVATGRDRIVRDGKEWGKNEGDHLESLAELDEVGYALFLVGLHQCYDTQLMWRLDDEEQLLTTLEIESVERVGSAGCNVRAVAADRAATETLSAAHPTSFPRMI